jgi:hypothetical protein
MKSVAALLALGMLCCWGCAGTPAVTTTGEPVSLHYSALGGRPFPYKMSYTVTVNVEGSTETWVSDIVYSAKVDTVTPDGSVIRRITFDDFSISTYSGSAPTPDPAAAGYKGQYMWLPIGPEGEIGDWKGLDGIRTYTADSRDLRDVLVQQMAMLFRPLPSEPVTIGATWQRKLEQPLMIMGGDFTQRTTVDYEVIGFGRRADRNCVKIRMTAAVAGEGKGLRGGGRNFWVKSAGDGKGEIWFDYENGLPVEYSLRTTVNRSLSYERAGKEDVATETSTVDTESKIKLAQ